MTKTETTTLTEWEVAQRLADSYYLRRGVRCLPEAFLVEVQQKFNPYHDPENGQFTFGPGGSGLGRSAGSPESGTGSGRSRYPVRVELPSYPSRVELPPSRPASAARPNQAAKPGAPLVKRFRHNPGIDLPAIVGAKANALSETVRATTGHQIHVTSGRRPPRRQAEAMFDNYLDRSSKRYGDRIAEAEVRQAFDLGVSKKLGRERTIQEMATVLDRQVRRGVYLSPHMRSNAIDIRTPSANVMRAIRRHPSVRSVLVEDDHIHIQFR